MVTAMLQEAADSNALVAEISQNWHKEPVKVDYMAAPPAAEAQLSAEASAWWVDAQSWPPLEEVPSAEAELTARRRYHDEADADEKGIHGVNKIVDFYSPDSPGRKRRMSFVDALSDAYEICLMAFGVVDSPTDIVAWGYYVVHHVVSFLTWFMQLRFSHQCSFQILSDGFNRPNSGIIAVLHGALTDFAHSPPEEEPAKEAYLQKLLVDWIGFLMKEIREVREHYIGTDGNINNSLDGKIDMLGFVLYHPNHEDMWRMLMSKSKVPVVRERDVHQVTRIFVELRSAWADPRFQAKWRVLLAEPKDPVLLQTVKSGRHGLFRRHYDILQRHGFVAGPGGAQAFGSLLLSLGATDTTVRKLFWDTLALSSCQDLPDLPVAHEVWAPGRRVMAFYDIYDHTAEWRYHFVHVEEPPSEWPVVGTTAGWLPGTVVAEPEPCDNPLEGFQRVRVRFDGYFCDTHELNHLKNREQRGSPSLNERVRIWGRRSVEASEFLVPVTQVRDMGDAPPQPLLSVLNLRPVDYFSNWKISDYNITNDGYVQDLCHGPCSMQQQLLGQYEVCSVFIRESENLEKIDLQQLRARLTGTNVIGWYLQWPQIQSKSLWGNGSVSKPKFFAFCTRAERMGIRTGWPHESHIYEFMAGKVWIPRMSLCKDFKVPPTTCIDFATFMRAPLLTARRALESVMRNRKLLWGAEPMPLESFRGVTKFGYSWCGFDVLPFKGIEGLVKACQDMFSKDGCEQTTILVQEMLPNVVAECRYLCFHDRLSGGYHKELVWVSQHERKFAHAVEGFSGMASSNVVPSEAIAQKIFGGDADAWRHAESEADRISNCWLQWLRAETTQPLQCTRIDFLVAKAIPGEATVWTCEVGECGGSLCSVEVNARNTVALNTAIRYDATGRFPAALPRPLRRHNGRKSH